MPQIAATSIPGHQNGAQQGALRVAVVFYGITRSLRLTLGSINRNLIAPARDMASELRTFGHFFDQDRIDNPRSKEAGALDPDEYRLLDLDQVEREAPGACLEQHGFDDLKAAGDPWKDGFTSLRNLVHQLHSLARATGLALAWQPEIVIFARPDLYYHDSVAPQLAALAGQHGPAVRAPDWAQWRGGCNDRFALARGDQAITAYGFRVARLAEYLALGKRIHSERFLKFALQDIPVGSFALRASRVRSNGIVVVEDFTPGGGKYSRMGLLPFAEFEKTVGRDQPGASGQGT